jgi:hypothetical protein
MIRGFSCHVCGQYLSSATEGAIKRHAYSVKHQKAATRREPTVERDEAGNVLTWAEAVDTFTDGVR